MINLPFSAEAESAVLGAVLVDPSAIVHLAPILGPEDFHVPAHRWLAESIWRCHGRKIPATTAAIITDLNVNGLWGADRPIQHGLCSGDLEILAKNAFDLDGDLIIGNARLVRELSFRRRGYETLTRSAGLFLDQKQDPETVRSTVLNNVAVAFEMANPRKSDIGAILDEEQKRLNDLADGRTAAVLTGIGWLDRLTGGLMPAETVVINAPYKARKTTLALNMVLRMLQSGIAVAIMTVGDSTRDSTARQLQAMVMNQLMLADNTNSMPASARTLLKPLTQKYHRDLQSRAASEMRPFPLYIYDSKDRVGRIAEADQIARRDSALRGVKVLVYDYATAIHDGATDYEKAVAFKSWFQNLCGETGLVGIAVAQKNEDAIKNWKQTSHSPGSKGGGAVPEMANFLIETTYEAPHIGIHLRLARNTGNVPPVSHLINPSSGLILDANKPIVLPED